MYRCDSWLGNIIPKLHNFQTYRGVIINKLHNHKLVGLLTVEQSFGEVSKLPGSVVAVVELSVAVGPQKRCTVAHRGLVAFSLGKVLSSSVCLFSPFPLWIGMYPLHFFSVFLPLHLTNLLHCFFFWCSLLSFCHFPCSLSCSGFHSHVPPEKPLTFPKYLKWQCRCPLALGKCQMPFSSSDIFRLYRFISRSKCARTPLWSTLKSGRSMAFKFSETTFHIYPRSAEPFPAW